MFFNYLIIVKLFCNIYVQPCFLVLFHDFYFPIVIYCFAGLMSVIMIFTLFNFSKLKENIILTLLVHITIVIALFTFLLLSHFFVFIFKLLNLIIICLPQSLSTSRFFPLSIYLTVFFDIMKMHWKMHLH